MQWIRSHLSFANLVSLMALFVALGGTTYAAVALPKNSVGAKQIKKNGVRAAEIQRNAVGASEIRSNAVAGGDILDNGVGAADIADNAVGSGEIVNGSLVEADLQAGLLDVKPNITVQTEEATVDLADGTSDRYDVHCPDGQLAIGGAARGDLDNSEDTNIGSSRPIISTTVSGAPADGGTFTGWRATVLNPTGGVTTGIRPQVWVICLTIP